MAGPIGARDGGAARKVKIRGSTRSVDSRSVTAILVVAGSLLHEKVG
jgi:hypothetical protein